MKNKTKQLLTYLIQNKPGIPITSLMKLSYIVDLVSVNKTKNPISDFEYRRYKYGPFDNKIYGYLKDLLKSNVINEDATFSQTGDEYIIYLFNEKNEFVPNKLSNKEKNIIDEVLESLKGYGAKALVELAYKTKPMKKIGAKIDNIKGLNQKLNLTAA
ncbi:MAG TPA: Panacea domain-containing protein [Thermodesulfobacteriota bacterium]|jgi:uncharacterized phage-associated protein|nr:Panacea domain-containing protein [Thermodesulfobacteriota bacterium]